MTDDENYPCLHCGSTESPTLDINDIKLFDNGVPVRLVDCYKTITGIKIETTSTNNKVCQMCQLQLKNAYTFMLKFKPQVYSQPPCLITKVEIEEENEKAYKESVFVSALTNKNLNSDKQPQADTLLKVKSENVNKNSKNQEQFTRDAMYECRKKFGQQSLINEHKKQQHSTDANNSNNECLICEKTFTKPAGLRSHQKIVHNRNCAKFICDFCGFQTKLKFHIVNHMKTKHLTSKEANADDDLFQVDEKDLQSYTYKPRFRREATANQDGGCIVCGKPYPNRFLLYRHQKTIHIVSSTGENEGKWRNNPDKKFQCGICGIVIAYQGRNRHLATHQLKYSIKCDLCQRVFENLTTLNLHTAKYHTGKQTIKISARKLHRCECGNTYKNVTVFTRHKLTHSETAKFNCSLCAALFQTSEAVTSHMRKAHAETYFKCPVLKCNSMLPSQEALDAHASLHNEISACECLVCIKSFSNFYELYHHYQVHHKKTGKIYKKGPTDNCKCQCGLKFATITLIKFHNIFVHGMKISKICLICHKNFRKMETYQAHLRTHDDDQAKRQCMNS